ncbi:LOW QUALITY PROTEIN: hypothetical protein ENH_00036000 [Eimeria necatrix]|uniref:Tyrosine-protein kinase ephrin type A/B receptor-like domain-containing protein n=1 Tax=Eimeria necatrix TaxID=51315 RepID=U6MJG2_9EIME|nr:LOW QUALITY PROTEIN: hypothetical protein ENH_00036000 [Eimeria necatrix]CDJ63213.1 hypothetical protein ENH_00036000 [Eimeria necatrix]
MTFHRSFEGPLLQLLPLDTTAATPEFKYTAREWYALGEEQVLEAAVVGSGSSLGSAGSSLGSALGSSPGLSSFALSAAGTPQQRAFALRNVAVDAETGALTLRLRDIQEETVSFQVVGTGIVSSTSTRVSFRVACRDGHFYSGGMCMRCPAGSFNNLSLVKETPQVHFSSCRKCPLKKGTVAEGSTSQDQCLCAKGYHKEQGQSECTPCPAGWYKDTVGDTGCTGGGCPANSVSHVEGAVSSDDRHCSCLPGYYAVYEEEELRCVEVERGHFSLGGFRAVPVKCPPFTSTAAASLAADLSHCLCEAGYQPASAAALGDPSSAASLLRRWLLLHPAYGALGDSQVCVGCGRRHFKGRVSAEACEKCPLHSFASSSAPTARASCSNCLPGFYPTASEDLPCGACKPHHFCVGSDPQGDTLRPFAGDKVPCSPHTLTVEPNHENKSPHSCIVSGGVLLFGGPGPEDGAAPESVEVSPRHDDCGVSEQFEQRLFVRAGLLPAGIGIGIGIGGREQQLQQLQRQLLQGLDRERGLQALQRELGDCQHWLHFFVSVSLSPRLLLRQSPSRVPRLQESPQVLPGGGRGLSPQRRHFAAARRQFAAERGLFAAARRQFAAERRQFAAAGGQFAVEGREFAAAGGEFAAERRQFAAARRQFAAGRRQFAAERRQCRPRVRRRKETPAPRGLPQVHPHHRGLRHALFHRRLTPIYVTVLFFLHTATTRNMLSLLDCSVIDYGAPHGTKSLLRAAMSVPCSLQPRSAYFRYFLLGIVGIAAWGIGIPLVSFSVLYANRKRLNSRETRLKFGFLHNGFVRRFWFWETVVFARKLCVLVISALSSSTVSNCSRLWPASVIAVIFNIYHLRSQPFDKRSKLCLLLSPSSLFWRFSGAFLPLFVSFLSLFVFVLLWFFLRLLLSPFHHYLLSPFHRYLLSPFHRYLLSPFHRSFLSLFCILFCLFRLFSSVSFRCSLLSLFLHYFLSLLTIPSLFHYYSLSLFRCSIYCASFSLSPSLLLYSPLSLLLHSLLSLFLHSLLSLWTVLFCLFCSVLSCLFCTIIFCLFFSILFCPLLPNLSSVPFFLTSLLSPPSYSFFSIILCLQLSPIVS